MDKPTEKHIQRIDSHQHFWQISNGYYKWLTEDISPLYRDFAPEDLRPQLSKSNIDKTILVQAAPDMAETDYMLSLAASTDFIVGVVGWVNMQDARAPSHIVSLAKNPYFKGIRPMLQDIIDDDWMLDPSLHPAFQTLERFGLSFDALVKPRHLNNLRILASRYPNLKIVIDHAAKPDIDGKQFDKWAKDIETLAQLPNVYCKLSGLVTEAQLNFELSNLAPFMHHLLAIFGASRLMWGSDWPVLNLVTNYSHWVELTEAFLANLSFEQQQQIWSKTAIEFYHLN